MHRRSCLSTLLLFCLALLVSVLPPAQPVAASEYPGAGWVHAGPIEGGCQTSGSCNSTTDPVIAGLFEYKPDRTFVGADEPPGGADHGGYPTYEKREKCWIEDGTGRYTEKWAAGSWHHGAYWQRVNGVWYKSREHWAFFHKYECYKVAPGPTAAPPTPIPTSTPVPPPAPGQLTLIASRCYTNGPGLATTLAAWAGAWNQSAYSAGATFSVPGQYTTVSYSIDTPAGWHHIGGALSGTVPTGSRVAAVFWRDDVCNVPTATPARDVTPTPTMGPCIDFMADAWLTLRVTGAGASVTPRLYERDAGTVWQPPTPDPALGTVQPGQPLQVIWDLSTLSRDFESDHGGISTLRWGVRDLTTNTDVLLIETEDEKELANRDGEVVIWGRTLRLSRVTAAAGLSYPGTFRFSRWLRNWSTWEDAGTAPALNTYIVDWGSGRTQHTAQFTPQAGHSYEAFAVAEHADTSCWYRHHRWSRARFVAGALPTATPCPSGDCPVPPPCDSCPTPTAPPTPTPMPTPTPLPPPPPPPAQATFRLRLHSRHDPASAWTGRPQGTHRDADAIHTSDGPVVSWPQGEILDWLPEITLQPLPAPPADPWYGPIYRYEQEILGWSFVSSAGQRASQPPGCLGAGHAPPYGLQGCAYPYVASPTEADMRTAPHVMWHTGRTPAQFPADAYAYTLPKLRPVDLQIQVAVRVTSRNLWTGQTQQQIQILPGTYTINLVTPRSVR